MGKSFSNTIAIAITVLCTALLLGWPADGEKSAASVIDASDFVETLKEKQSEAVEKVDISTYTTVPISSEEGTLPSVGDWGEKIPEELLPTKAPTITIKTPSISELLSKLKSLFENQISNLLEGGSESDSDSDSGFDGGGSSGDYTGSLPFDHYNAEAYDGQAIALILCSGDSASSCSVNGISLSKNGYDKGRELWSNWSTSGVGGTVTCVMNGETLGADVGSSNTTDGKGC